MSNFRRPSISQPSEGTIAIAFGHNTIRVPSSATKGAFSIMEVLMGPGDGTPLHVHEREEETFRILYGKFGFWCGEDYVELEKDGIIALPKGVPHRFANVGNDEGEVMVILTPGGFERFFIEAAENPKLDPLALSANYGLRFLSQ